MNWALEGGPWSFDSAMLVLEVVPQGKEPRSQIHGLLSGFMSEITGQQLENFFSEYFEYDVKNNTSTGRDWMRVRVRLNVRKPLKRRNKITRRNGTEVIV